MAKKESVEKVEQTENDVPVTPTASESVYTAEELTANHKVFGTSKAIVTVALKLAGKKTATFSEAKTIIEKFKHKEV